MAIEGEIKKSRDEGYTFVNVAWYFDNLVSFAGPKKQEGGSYLIDVPIGPEGMYAIHNGDVGEIFARVFDDYDTYNKKKINVAGGLIASAQEIADAFSSVFPDKTFKAAVLVSCHTSPLPPHASPLISLRTQLELLRVAILPFT